MIPSTFTASVQYNDMKGSAAADRSDGETARKWLQDKGYLNESEVLAGISIFVGENHGKHSDPISVTFYIKDIEDYESLVDAFNDSDEPFDMKCVNVSMGLNEFFGLFKRFSVYLSPKALMEGKEFNYREHVE